MKKILFINPPYKELVLRDYFCSSISKGGYYWHPIDFVVLSGILKKFYNIHIFDFMVDKNGFKLLNKIKNLEADIIVFLTSSITFQKDFEFIKNLKSSKNKVFVVGDILLDINNYFKERHDYIDGFILDFTNPDIINFLENNNNKFLPYKNVEEFSYPIPLHEKFLIKNYNYPFNKYKKFVSILTTYGCNLGCYFCNSGCLGYKIRNIDNIIEEIFYVKKLKIKQIFIKDMTFASTRSHTIEFLKEIIKNKFDIVWNCYTRPDLLDEELIYLMKKAGCYMVQFGIETLNTNLLKNLNKNIDLERTKYVLKLLKKYDISFGFHFIFGLPGDDIEYIEQNLNFIKNTKPHYISLNIFSPRCGSKLYYETTNFINNFSYYYSIIKSFYKKYYFSLGYISNIIKKIYNFYELKNILNIGFSLTKNMFFKIQKF